jgi:hypothetical protein
MLQLFCGYLYGTCNVSSHEKPIITIIILVITFMQDIYNYILETNHVSRVHSVAVVFYLQFVVHVMLFLPRGMFCTFTLTLLVVYMQCPI